MFKLTGCIYTISNVREIKLLKQSFAIFQTELNELFLLNIHNFSTIEITPHHLFDKNVENISFSQNGYMAFSKKNELFILDIQNNIIINKILLANHIDGTSFHPTMEHLFVFSGGKIFQYGVTSNTKLSTISSPEKSTVILLAYQNALVCVVFGEELLIYNIYTKIRLIKLHSNSKITAISFIDSDRLIYATSNNSIKILDINSNKTIKKIDVLQNIYHIVKFENINLALLAGAENFISVMDLKTYKIIYHKYIILDDNIINLKLIDDNYLIVALQNNKIVKIELHNFKRFESALLHNLIDEAYAINDLTLRYTKTYEILENRFKEHFKSAMEYLMEKNERIAREILKSYVKAKSKEIRALFLSFNQYENLCDFIKTKKYALAYAVATKYHHLQETPEFKTMQELYNTTYLNAIKEVLKNNIEVAIKLFEPFLSVAIKKPQINFLLQNSHIIKKYLSAKKQSNYTTIDALIKEYKILKELPIYQPYSVVQNYPELELLQKSYNKNDFKTSYELIDKFPSLQKTEIGSMLQKYWQKLIIKYEKLALDGKYKEIKKSASELEFIKTRGEKIQELLKVSFIVKIKNLLDIRDTLGAKTFLISYIDMFGFDEDIALVAQQLSSDFAH